MTIVKGRWGNYCSCKTKRKYDDKFDAYYCPTCNIWLEGKCSDESCEFCSKRTEKPLMYNQEEPKI